jgi:protein arginine N-methyltransferase 1
MVQFGARVSIAVNDRRLERVRESVGIDALGLPPMTRAARALEMLSFHRFLLGETNVRLHRFRQAIAAKVKPGDAVLDLGTGTGMLAFFACLAGARRVYAVETGEVLEVARILARENGLESRVVFFEGASADVELPEQVDVVVSDTFGLWQPDALRSVMDARDRLLKPGGIFIPASVEVFVAPVEIPDTYQRHVDFWNRPRNGIDLSVVRQFAVNHCYPARVKPTALLAEPVSLGHVNFSDVRSAVLTGHVCPAARRVGTLHGLCAWVKSDLTDDIELANRPGATTTNYAQGFFPVSRPVPIFEGDRIKVAMTSYDSFEWRWQVEVERHANGVIQKVVRFDHSTFLGMPMSMEALRHLAPDRVPILSRRGQAEYCLLGLSDGKTSIEELRQRLRQRYPDLFRSSEDVTAFVAEVLGRSA